MSFRMVVSKSNHYTMMFVSSSAIYERFTNSWHIMLDEDRRNTEETNFGPLKTIIGESRSYFIVLLM